MGRRAIGSRRVKASTRVSEQREIGQAADAQERVEANIERDVKTRNDRALKQFINGKLVTNDNPVGRF